MNRFIGTDIDELIFDDDIEEGFSVGLAFDEADHPRDSSGKFTSGGGGGGSLPTQDTLHFEKSLGGTTGAKLFTDPKTDKQYVIKRGASAGHITAEAQANDMYRALGVKVPNSQLHKDENGPYMVSEFIEGKQLGELSKDDRAIAYGKLKEDFVADALLGNWDAIGTGADNIIVDDKGEVWRIDNGGSLQYRAQGATKGSKWNGDVTELQTLRDPSVNKDAAAAYAGLTDNDIKNQIQNVMANQHTLPHKDEIMKARIAKLEQIQKAPFYSNQVPVTKAQEPKASAPVPAHSYMGKSPKDRFNDLSAKLPKDAFNQSQIRKVAMMNDGTHNDTIYIPDSFTTAQQDHLLKAFPDKKVKYANASKHLAPLMAQHAVANPHQLWQKAVAGKDVKVAAAAEAKTNPDPAAKPFYAKVKTAPVKKAKAPVKPTPTPSQYAAPKITKPDPGEGVIDKIVDGDVLAYRTSPKPENLATESLKWSQLLNHSEASAVSTWKGSAASTRKAEREGKVDAIQHWTNAINKSPTYSGMLYRGVSHVTPGSEFYEALTTVGGHVELQTSAGASREMAVAFGFGSGANGAVFRVITNNAAMIEDGDGHKSEKETILRKGGKFRVVNVAKKIKAASLHSGSHTTQLFVDLEQLPHETQGATVVGLSLARDDEPVEPARHEHFIEQNVSENLIARLPASSYETLDEDELDEKIARLWDG